MYIVKFAILSFLSSNIHGFTPQHHHHRRLGFSTKLKAHTSYHKREQSNIIDPSISNITTTTTKNNRQSIISQFQNAIKSTIAIATITGTTILSPYSLEFNHPNNNNNIHNLQSSLQITSSNTIAHASDYTGTLTDEQKAVAEAWRIVDNNFLDRTFNHQDWFAIRQDAVIKHKYKSMEEARQAIDTMVASLGDKYTRYLPPAKYRSIVDAATGTLAGVGVELSVEKDPSTGGIVRVYASDVEPNSPASKGGIQPGDTFLEVDGMRMDDNKATPDDVASKIRGPEGSKVGIVMERQGKTLDFILTREPITITSVRSYISEKGGGGGNVGKVGVIRIKSFSGTTASTVKEAIEDLKQKGAKAFVLDVRGNPGGLLPGGVDTAALFLDTNKPVVFVVDKKGIVDSQSTYTTGIDLDSPLVIFVNGNTASAAEVMTAGLKENNRAVVVGEQTFGKGIIQTIRQLSNDNGGVAVTVARYETPQHHDINKQGIPVDIPIKDCQGDDAAVCIPPQAFKPIS